MRPVADDHPFLRWSHARGIDTSRVRLVQDDATGERAVVCADTDAIKADTVCLRVPFRACVGTSGLRCGATSCPLDDGAEGSAKALYTPSDRLAATLAKIRWESERGVDDAWTPYVDALPRDVDSPVNGWTNEEIGEMQFARGIGNCAKVKARDAGTVKKLMETHGEESWAKHWTWALACVRSRAVDLERGESFLAPVLDMLNHSHGSANVKWDASEDGEAVVLRALTTVAPGEELVTQYACEPAESFLLYMGFVGAMNPYDRVELWSSLSHAADWFAETFRSESGEIVLDKAAGRAVADELEAQQRARERASIVGLAGGAPANESAELKLREIQSTLMGPSVGWTTSYDEALWLMFRHFSQALMPDENPDHYVMHAIKKRCEEILLSMKTTIEEDEALFSAEDTPRRLRLAVEYRLYKKCILVRQLQGAEVGKPDA